MILEGEIKDAKISSFSSHFQTLIKHLFPLYFLYELLMSLRSVDESLFELTLQIERKACENIVHKLQDL